MTLDWPALIRRGLHDLRLPPAQFWALTPAELQVMLGLTKANAPMLRSRLAELQQSFPDRTKDEK